ncbi:MAG: hypothetical protein ACLT4Y_11235 [Bifidobacterium breve]
MDHAGRVPDQVAILAVVYGIVIRAVDELGNRQPTVVAKMRSARSCGAPAHCSSPPFVLTGRREGQPDLAARLLPVHHAR